MMMKKLISIVLAAGVLTTTASALELKVDPDAASNKITVYGKTVGNSVVTMMVTSGLAENEALTIENVNDKMFGGGQWKADDEGNFERTFALDVKPNDSWYTVTVYAKAEDMSAQERIFLPDKATNDRMLQDFNEATAAEVKALCQKYSMDIPILRIDMTEYGVYEDEIGVAIIAERAKLSGGFTSTPTLENAIKTAFARVHLSMCDTTEVDAYVQNYTSNLGLTLDEKYASLKDEIADKFVGFRMAEPDGDIVALFEKAMALTVLNHSLRTEIAGVLQKYNDAVFQLDLSAYSKYDALDIAKALYGKNYDDVADLKTDYNGRVKELASEKSGGGANRPGNAGGRPSSSGGGSGKVSNNISSIQTGTELYQEIIEGIQLPFKDLDDVEWAKEYIKKLYGAGIVSGVTSTTYEPERPVTRGEICKLICNALGTEVIVGINPFSDVSEAAWYYDYVINAYDNELIVGDNGSFMPETNIRRRDFALMIARSLKENGLDEITGHPFYDITEADVYAETAISTLVGYGIASGKDKTVFAPADYVTRAEAAKMICLMMEVIGNE